MTRIAVVDHGAGNLVSISQGLRAAGAAVDVISTPDGLEDAAGAVLPGVGASAAAMARLGAAGFIDPLRQYDRPLLGICVGLQLLFDASEEDDSPGLGLLPGKVSRLRDAPRLPHIGWNDVAFDADPLFAGISAGSAFYFVHSYAPVPEDQATIIGRAEHGAPFVAAVRAGSRSGVQFHPERSGPAGLRLLANFVAEAGHAA
jgi:glutamine amidotransferase